jgi:hypothetical protein
MCPKKPTTGTYHNQVQSSLKYAWTILERSFLNKIYQLYLLEVVFKILSHNSAWPYLRYVDNNVK